MKRIVCLIILLVVVQKWANAQKKLPDGARRIVFSLGIGAAWTGNEPFKVEDDELYYNPKKETLAPKYSSLNVPLEIGLAYTLNKRLVLKTEFSYSKVYAKVGTIYTKPTEYWLVQEYIPYKNKEIGIGLQWTRRKFRSRYRLPYREKNFVAPVVRKYAELLYVHSFYNQSTQFANDAKAIQFGNLSLGFYRNYFFSKSKSFMIYGGCRIGIPIYRTRDHIENILQNTENTVVQKDTWKELDRTNTFLKYFQLRWGIKYVLPTLKKSKL